MELRKKQTWQSRLISGYHVETNPAAINITGCRVKRRCQTLKRNIAISRKDQLLKKLSEKIKQSDQLLRKIQDKTAGVGTQGKCLEKPFKCSESKCSYITNYYNHLVSHRRMHTGERPFKCEDCSASFPFLTGLTSHRRQHTGERPYPCKICNFAGTQWNCLKVHMHGHNAQGAFKCSLCPYWSSKSGLIYNHEVTCHNVKYVGKTTKYAVKLESTYAFVEGNVRTYKCKDCSASFPFFTSLGSHRSQYIGKRPFPCKICNFAGTQWVCLKVHMKGHNTQEGFKCSVCPYWSKKSGLIYKHEGTCHNGVYFGKLKFGLRPEPSNKSVEGNVNEQHKLEGNASKSSGESIISPALASGVITSERPFKCLNCSATFPFLYGLISHRRQHTGERPYPCKICNFAGTQWNCLKSHMKGHEAQGTYKCAVCPYWSSRAGFIRKHEATCHNGQYVGKAKRCAVRSELSSESVEVSTTIKQHQPKGNADKSSGFVLSPVFAFQEFKIDSEFVNTEIPKCDEKLQRMAVVRISGKSNLRGLKAS